MSNFDLITDDELADLPDDPQVAFMQFVRLAQGRLTVFENNYDHEARGSSPLETMQHSFMNAVIGAARTFGIEPVAALKIPLHRDFDWQSYQQFRADLDNYLTQIRLQTSVQRRRESVPLSDEAKGRIRSHLHGIRQCLDGAQELPASKRSRLQAKLSEFELALEKTRVNLFAVSRVVLEVLSASANVVALSESPTLNKLLMNIMHVAGEAKAADEENRKLPTDDAPKALLPPRQEQPKPKKKKAPDFDDEIPF